MCVLHAHYHREACSNKCAYSWILNAYTRNKHKRRCILLILLLMADEAGPSVPMKECATDCTTRSGSG